MVPEIVESFLDDSKALLYRIVEARTNRDLETLEHETHSLGSSAGYLGAMALQGRARRIEAACRAREKRLALDLADGIAGEAELAWKALSEHIGG